MGGDMEKKGEKKNS